MSKRLNTIALATLLAAGAGGFALNKTKCSGAEKGAAAQTEGLDAEASAGDLSKKTPSQKKYLSPATREQLLRYLSGADSTETPEQLLQKLFDQSLGGDANSQRKLLELAVEDNASAYLNALAKESGIKSKDFRTWCFYAAQMNDSIRTIKEAPPFDPSISDRHNLMGIYKPFVLAAYELLQNEEDMNPLQNAHFLGMVGQTESSIKDLFLETKEAIGTDADTAYVLRRLGMMPQE